MTQRKIMNTSRCCKTCRYSKKNYNSLYNCENELSTKETVFPSEYCQQYDKRIALPFSWFF